MTTKEDTARARDEARAQLDSIVEMVEALKEGGTIDGDEVTEEEARERIQEDPLSRRGELCLMLDTEGISATPVHNRRE